MTKDEALKLALEALENHEGNYKLGNAGCDRQEAAITAIKEALAQPAQEPLLAGVAHIDDLDLWHFFPLRETVNFPDGTKFYTTPQQRPWVGLTFAEICECENDSLLKFARAIEAMLKEKNFD
jgi:hypothetical protein